MKNFVKWFGIIVFVAVIGFSFIGCLSFITTTNTDLNGDWEFPNGWFIVTITSDVGVFNQITGGNFKIALDNGNVQIGDQRFRNIRKTGYLTWSAQQLLVQVGTGILAGWEDCTITMAADGKTFVVVGITVADTTFTRK